MFIIASPWLPVFSHHLKTTNVYHTSMYNLLVSQLIDYAANMSNCCLGRLLISLEDGNTITHPLFNHFICSSKNKNMHINTSESSRTARSHKNTDSCPEKECSMTIIGSRPSDHYFRSVCLFVCRFVCADFFSAVFDPISIKLGRTLYVWVKLCPLEYRGCATLGAGWPLKTSIFRGFGAQETI